ncbi:MAG: HAD family phosphatase [Firmicutes bacterium]|nr:HAD family phosphatase [Bacillota bacterium]
MKLIAIDLDGTLLTDDKKITEETKDYLMSLKKMGYIIVIATGRNLKSAYFVTDGAPFAHCIISSSGASVFDNLNKKLLKEEALPLDKVCDISKLYNDNIKYIEFNDMEFHNIFGKDIKESEVVNEVVDMDEFLKDKNDILQLAIAFNDDEIATKTNDYIKNNIDGLNPYTARCTYSEHLYIEVLKEGVSKYSAISYLARLCGISNDNIIAIGDSENDLTMVKNSGVGVAMKNAVSELKQVAKYVTKSNNDNGVIEFLKLYL